MGDEREAAAAPRSCQEVGGVFAACGQLLAGSENEEVVLLGQAAAIMNLLPHQEQQLPGVLLHVPLHAANPDIMVGDDHCIQSTSERRHGYVPMAAGTVRIARVHMQIDDYLVHADPVDDLG